jgi:ribonuclease HI
LEDKENILEVSGIPSSQRYDKYLGLPALVGKSRTKEFRSIIDRVWKKLQDWKFKLLSQAGKEILLKAVIQAIPTYCMSLFLLPKGLCLEINSLMQRFWWGNQTTGSRIHWMKWSKMGEAKNCGGMGFRDFKCFNKALLAKQLWRLWNMPDSLVSQIIKAKYYPRGSILEAQLGNKPSFAWRSIWGSGDLLKDGLVWRIGNGSTVKIWSDKWVPIPDTYSIQSPPQAHIIEPNATVSELIDRNTQWWNMERLEQIFRAEEIKAILSIPLSCTNQPDVLIWRGTAKGSFSVKSAYYVAKAMEARERASTSTGTKMSEVWRQIWKLKLPNAEKNFIWRACHDILPTKEKLLRRKISVDPLCPLCGLVTETSFHVLWDCSSARDVWSMCERKIQKSHFDGPNFMEVVEGIFKKCEEEEINLFVGLARKIWFRRNEVVHGGSFTHPNVLVQQAKEAVAEFKAANIHVDQGVEGRSMLRTKRWVRPCSGWYKLNWDAAVCEAQGTVGMGAVVRNDEGSVMAARCMVGRGFLDPCAAEAWAGTKAIRWGLELGLTNIQVEGDAKNVVEAINSAGKNWSKIGHIVEDMQYLLRNFTQWKVDVVSRDANNAAHTLAKLAVSHGENRTWLGVIPECICEIVLAEQSTPRD